jgi:hypothetical protein
MLEARAFNSKRLSQNGRWIGARVKPLAEAAVDEKSRAEARVERMLFKRFARSGLRLGRKSWCTPEGSGALSQASFLLSATKMAVANIKA